MTIMRPLIPLYKLYIAVRSPLQSAWPCCWAVVFFSSFLKFLMAASKCTVVVELILLLLT